MFRVFSKWFFYLFLSYVQSPPWRALFISNIYFNLSFAFRSWFNKLTEISWTKTIFLLVHKPLFNAYKYPYERLFQINQTQDRSSGNNTASFFICSELLIYFRLYCSQQLCWPAFRNIPVHSHSFLRFFLHSMCDGTFVKIQPSLSHRPDRIYAF